MGTDAPNPEQMTEAEMRAAYEAEIKRVRIEHVLLETVVTLINLGMRRTGLMPGTEDERDPEQVSAAVDAVRALMPTVETVAPDQAQPIKEALSQLQMAYVQSLGQGEQDGDAGVTASTAQATDATGGAAAQSEPKPGEPGPAQRSGRLWVPGQ